MKFLIWIASYICPAIFLVVMCLLTQVIAQWIGMDGHSTVIIFLIVVILRAWSEQFRRSVYAAFNL